MHSVTLNLGVLIDLLVHPSRLLSYIVLFIGRPYLVYPPTSHVFPIASHTQTCLRGSSRSLNVPWKHRIFVASRRQPLQPKTKYFTLLSNNIHPSTTLSQSLAISPSLQHMQTDFQRYDFSRHLNLSDNYNNPMRLSFQSFPSSSRPRCDKSSFRRSAGATVSYG